MEHIIKTFQVSETFKDELFKSKKLQRPKELNPNNYYILKYEKNQILVKAYEKYIRVVDFKIECSGIKAKDLYQSAYFDAILDKDIELISCMGLAGSGKTMLAIAGALELLEDENNNFKELVIFKSTQTDKIEDIGFLKGDKEEKIKQAFLQIEKFLIKNLTQSAYDVLKKKEIIQFQPMSQILGWSIENSIIILDEAQILDTNKIHQVLTRVGENSKLILTGDPKQQSHKNLFKHSGLEYINENWDEDWMVKVGLEVCYRSKIAKKASEYVPDWQYSSNK